MHSPGGESASRHLWLSVGVTVRGQKGQPNMISQVREAPESHSKHQGGEGFHLVEEGGFAEEVAFYSFLSQSSCVKEGTV